MQGWGIARRRSNSALDDISSHALQGREINAKPRAHRAARPRTRVWICRHCELREAIHPLLQLWIASRSLSSGAHSRDPLARNDGLKTPYDGLKTRCDLAV